MEADANRTGPVTISRELFDFLMGAGGIDGLHFGEHQPDAVGAFWWRRLLRDADIGSYGLAFRERREMLKSVLARDFQTVHAVDDLGWDAEPASDAAPRPGQETPAPPPA